jgi:hypothetical protein
MSQMWDDNDEEGRIIKEYHKDDFDPALGC